MAENVDQSSLTALAPARRNRFFAGKMLSAADLEKEQDYGLAKRRLSNRLMLGAGVVCGLDMAGVVTPDGAGVTVTAGMALDGWGREIVVPDDVLMVPLGLTTDDVGLAMDGEPTLPSVHVTVGYDEQLADDIPAFGKGLEAGTVVEGHRLRVRPGAAPELALEADDDIIELLRAGRLRAALCRLSATACAAVPDDPDVVLANVTLTANGSLAVDSCGPRAVVPTNLLLTRLLGCLATSRAAGGAGAGAASR